MNIQYTPLRSFFASFVVAAMENTENEYIYSPNFRAGKRTVLGKRSRRRSTKFFAPGPDLYQPFSNPAPSAITRVSRLLENIPRARFRCPVTSWIIAVRISESHWPTRVPRGGGDRDRLRWTWTSRPEVSHPRRRRRRRRRR